MKMDQPITSPRGGWLVRRVIILRLASDFEATATKSENFYIGQLDCANFLDGLPCCLVEVRLGSSQHCPLDGNSAPTKPEDNRNTIFPMQQRGNCRIFWLQARTYIDATR